MEHPQAILVLDRLKIQDANLISSPLTWGFPAPSAILGFTHALERKLTLFCSDLCCSNAVIICHDFTPKIHRLDKFNDAVLKLKRFPLTKEGKTASIVEEGRADLIISLLIPLYTKMNFDDDQSNKERSEFIFNIVQQRRIAGGSIFPDTDKTTCSIEAWPYGHRIEQQKLIKKMLRNSLPGSILIQRDDLLIKRTKELQASDLTATNFDALLSFAGIDFKPTVMSAEDKDSEWIEVNKHNGWLVPISIGFQAISPKYKPGQVAHARDANYPFQFVENIYSLGEWRGAHRFINQPDLNLNNLCWRYHADVEHGIYQCINQPVSLPGCATDSIE